jgi:hypothetical protein
MRIGPTNPFHISRAYQTAPPKPGAKPTAASPIVAAVVPGRVNFAANQPTQAGPALPFYRHPADKNAAATAINAGRSLDIQA